MFSLARALQLDHPVPSFVRYVACIFVWLGLWLNVIAQTPSWFCARLRYLWHSSTAGPSAAP